METGTSAAMEFESEMNRVQIGRSGQAGAWSGCEPSGYLRLETWEECAVSRTQDVLELDKLD